MKSFRDGNGTSKRLLKFGSESAGKPFYFEADAASDGTLYVLALILFSQNPNASGISLVEEPELGLHPRLLDSFVDQLREYARDQQIILTTHSPLLLDSLKPEEVWITTRDDQGFSALACMAAYSELDRWRDNFNTGEIWMNVAEAQLATSE
ncbi:ATP-binding protein [bacterium]|nr:ATP-binding protein [bacterium]